MGSIPPNINSASEQDVIPGLETLQGLLATLKEEIENMRPKRGEAYSQKVEEYNQIVNQYNSLLAITQDLIDQYNLQVVSYNECAVVP